MWMFPPAPHSQGPPPPKKKKQQQQLTVYMLMYCKRAHLLSSHPQLFIYSFIHVSSALEDGTYMIKYENQTVQSAVTAVSMYGKGMF